jgi:WD40 repeat protein
MDNRNDLFHPERVDEQVEHLARIQDPQQQDGMPGAPIIAALQCIYKEDEAILEHAWARLASVEAATHTPGNMRRHGDRHHYRDESTMQETHFSHETSGPVMPSSPTFVRPPERPRHPRQRRWRAISLIAATLTIVVIVGSMLLVINAVHQRQTNNTTVTSSQKTATPTPTPQLQEGQIVYTSQPIDLAMPVVWSPDGSRVATAINRTTVESWDAQTGKNILNYPVNGDIAVANVAWSPNGSILAVAGSSTIYLFNARTAQLIHAFSASNLVYNGTTTSPLASSHGTSGIGLLNSALPLAGASFGDVVWSPNGRYVATVWNGFQHGIYVWDATTGLLFKSLTNFPTSVISLNWSHKENLLAVLMYPVAQDGVQPEAEIWDTTTWTVVKHYPNVAALDWSPDGTQLALADAGQVGGKDVRIVDAFTGQSVKQFAESAGSITDIHWSPDGSRLAIESQQYGNSISIWSITSGTLLYKFPTKGTVYEAVWSPDSKYMSCSQVIGGYATKLHVSILIFVA